MTIQEACQLAVAHHQAGRLAEAEGMYREILARHPNQPDVLHHYGVLLSQAGRHEQGIALIRRAIAINPSSPAYHGNLARVLRAAGRHEEAVDAYRHEIALRPRVAKPHFNLARLLDELGRRAEAVALYRQTIGLDPNHGEAHAALAAALAQLGRNDEARAALEHAVATVAQPSAALYNALANSLAESWRLDEAEAAYRRAIALDPQFPDPQNGLAHLLWRSGEVDGAIERLRAAVRLRPNDPTFHSHLLFALQFSRHETPQSIFDAHRQFDEVHARPLRGTIRPHTNDRDPNRRRLRVGWVSSDFRNHVCALYTIPLLAALDRAQVELFCYSHAPQADRITERVRSLADAWRETADASDERIAEMIRADAIDILVDQNMHMTYSRPLIFARKPAPVQLAAVAYPGTTGLSAMDYRLTDPYLDPPDGSDAGRYSEASVRLETFWCYDPRFAEPVGDPPMLANGFVTFGCLNNFAKVNDGVLSLWARVLTAAPASRLMLLAPPGRRRQAVLEKFAAEGVDRSRVAFVDFRDRRRDYMRLYRDVDIFLDTVPYNGHTTSLDAMWMGVPVVTLIGHTVVGRAGWSQLNNLQLTELAARDEAGFVRIASELAADAPRLMELRRTLRERMAASPLIDMPRYARSLEAAFRTMWRAWCAGGEER